MLVYSVLRDLSDSDRSTAANAPRPAALCPARKNPQCIRVNTPPVFPGLQPRIWRRLFRLVMNAMSDRLLPEQLLPLSDSSPVRLIVINCPSPVTPSPSNRMLKKSSGLEKAEVQVEAERGSDCPHLRLSLSLSLNLSLSGLSPRHADNGVCRSGAPSQVIGWGWDGTE
jgi:hypothetical protein